jgi:hypothetical protein
MFFLCTNKNNWEDGKRLNKANKKKEKKNKQSVILNVTTEILLSRKGKGEEDRRGESQPFRERTLSV